MVLSRQNYIIRCPGCGAKNRVPHNRLADHPVCAKCKTHLPGDPLFPEYPVDLSDHTFPHEVLSFKGPVAVYFWSPGCAYCKSLGPIFDQQASNHSGRIKFAKVMLERCPYAASKFSVMSVPTVLFFKQGREIDRLVGEPPRNQLEDRLRRLLA